MLHGLFLDGRGEASQYGRAKSICEWRREAKRGNGKKCGAAAVGPENRQMRTAQRGHGTNFSDRYTSLKGRVVGMCGVPILPGLALPASLRAVLDT